MPHTNPRIHWAWWLLAIALLAAWQYWPRHAASQPASSAVTQGQPSPRLLPPKPMAAGSPSTVPGFLPAEAGATIALIQRGGPFPYRQDGGVFGNRESRLPPKPRGWYHEYTVDTPGLDHRGARRVITGGNPPRDWYFTSDHYDSFLKFDPGTASKASP